MADAAAEETTEEGEPKKKGKKKLFIIIGAVLILAIGGFMFMGGGGSKKLPKGATTTTAPPTVLGIVKLDPLVLSLDDGSYLKMDLSVEVVKKVLEKGEKAPEWEAVSPFKGDDFKETYGELGRNAAQGVMLHMASGQLSSGQGKEQAKQQVVKAVEKAYEGGVDKVLFGDFVLQ